MQIELTSSFQEKEKKGKDYAGSENHSTQFRKRSHFGTEYRNAPLPRKGEEQ